MTAFSFVHAADLHLGSPFRGVSSLVSSSLARQLQNATFEAFDEVIRLCLDRSVDFLLVAGDIYDSADRDLRAQLHFHQGLKTLSERGIRSFVVHGNHDPLDGWSTSLRWPPEVKIFRADLESVPFHKDGRQVATIHGISFPKRAEERNLARLFPTTRDAEGIFQIGVLHCNVGTNTGHDPYAPCDLEDLRRAAVDYWALGHVHTSQILSERPHVVYSGNTQGRSIRETGARGCYLVEVSERGTVKPGFVATDKIRWFTGSLDIAGIETMDQLNDRITSLVESHRNQAAGRPVITRLTIEGRGPLHHELLREDAVATCLRHCRQHFAAATPFAWIEQIDLECRPDVDLDQAATREDMAGSALRVAARLRDATADQINEIFRPLLAHPFARDVVAAPDPDEFNRLLQEASLLCYDMLESN